MPVNFAEIIRRRTDVGLTLQECADRATRAGFSGFGGSAGRVRWKDVESGRYADPRLSTLEAVAVALGCQVQDLLLPPAAPAAGKPQRLKSRSGSAGSKARP